MRLKSLNGTGVKEEQIRKRGRTGVIWLPPFVAFCGVAFLLLGYLCQSAQMVRVQYELVSKREEIKVLSSVRADLELSVQELTSLERVERVAIDKLQMIAPTERHVIEVVWNKLPTESAELAVELH